MNRTLVVLGLALLAVGLAWPWLRRLPFGHLPGDLHFRLGDVEFHIPLATSLVVSLVLSLLLWLWRR